MENFDLTAYLTGGVERIVKNILRATLKDPRESAFMLKYSIASREASKKRAATEENGEHIPPFLIASITSSCNLHCAGCYARHNHACADSAPEKQLTDTDWLRIFREANDMGIGFILLAGGEPMIRKDVIRAAGEVPEILFPIFTNGTMVNDEYLALFDRCRNLVPIFSIEGHQKKTDERRGAEPCPFSPYSDINVKETSLKEALDSRLFTALRSCEILTGDHTGGCVLFEQKESVEAILKQEETAHA